MTFPYDRHNLVLIEQGTKVIDYILILPLTALFIDRLSVAYSSSLNAGNSSEFKLQLWYVLYGLVRLIEQRLHHAPFVDITHSFNSISLFGHSFMWHVSSPTEDFLPLWTSLSLCSFDCIRCTSWMPFPLDKPHIGEARGLWRMYTHSPWYSPQGVLAAMLPYSSHQCTMVRAKSGQLDLYVYKWG